MGKENRENYVCIGLFIIIIEVNGPQLSCGVMVVGIVGLGKVMAEYRWLETEEGMKGKRIGIYIVLYNLKVALICALKDYCSIYF